MNVSTVKLFLEVAEAGSFSKIAARRQTVQSHVSRQITDFEQQCGGRLFRRTGRGVELTDLGTRAAIRLRSWLQETERLEQELRSESGQIAGTVRLGIIPSAAHPLMTRLFERLQAEHPSVRLDIAEAQGTELARQRRSRSRDPVPLPASERARGEGAVRRQHLPRIGARRCVDAAAHAQLLKAERPSPGAAAPAEPLAQRTR